MCLLLIILIVVALYYFLQNDQSKHMSVGQNTCEQGDAVEILRQRYAQGEIDEVEYKERKKLLESR